MIVQNETAIIITDHDRIEIPVGTNYIYNNNNLIKNDTNAVIKDNRIYLPIRAVLESADFTVAWDSTTNTVNAYIINPNSGTSCLRYKRRWQNGRT